MSKVKAVKIEEQLEKDFVESKLLFKAVFEHSPAGIIVMDSQECIVTWNPMAEKMLGMKREDLFNQSVSFLYQPKEWKRIRSLNICRRGMLSNIDTKVICKDGSLLDVSASVSMLEDSEGKTIGFIALFQDITDRKRANELILQAKLAAEEANNAKSIFLAKMSHEVRTPMNAIVGMIDLTLDSALTGEQKDNLIVAKDAADHLLGLINDILDLSRAQAGKVVIQEVEINVPDIVKNVCKGMMVLARNKGVDLVWSIDPGIPRPLMGDPVRIRQVIVNLVNNAIKFTHKGRVHVNVKKELMTGKNCQVVFEVIDSGIGISPKNLPHVFDLFTDAHNTTARRYGGTGLGLAICKKIVEMMDGSLEVESVEGTGSTFRFSVIFGYKPGLFGNLGGAQDPKGETAALSVPPELRHLRILSAEDNAVNQRIVVRVLEKLGWKVTTVNNGQEVLDILNNQTFDVILMDDNMPLLSGIEAVQVIRREEKQTGHHVPVIAMTANAMATDRKKYLASGMDGYVSKPIDRDLLYEEIVNLVTQRLKN